MTDKRKEDASHGNETVGTLLDDFNARTVADTTGISELRPTVREVISNHPCAQARLNRETEAMEFDPEEIYSALERVQEEYDAFEAAKKRPIVTRGVNYVAFGLNGFDWHTIFEMIKEEIDDETMDDYIAHVVVKIMSDITGEHWKSHNSLPLILTENRIRDVIAYHDEVYNRS